MNLNCFIPSEQKTNLNLIKKIENKDFDGIVMSSEGTKILKVIQYWKSDKLPSIIYADLEFLIKKVDWCQHNLGKSSTTKVVQHIPCRYSVSTIWTFDGIKNKHDNCRGEECMKKSAVIERLRLRVLCWIHKH